MIEEMFELKDITIRRARRTDYGGLGELMFDAVRRGSSPYTEAQRKAWAPMPRSGRQWQERLDAQFVVVAELGDKLIGFMSLASNGYIDLAFIRPGFRGLGVFRLLYAQVERESMRQNVARLWLHASLSAKDAFASFGFAVICQETVAIGEIELLRYEMEKQFEA